MAWGVSLSLSRPFEAAQRVEQVTLTLRDRDSHGANPVCGAILGLCRVREIPQHLGKSAKSRVFDPESGPYFVVKLCFLGDVQASFR